MSAQFVWSMRLAGRRVDPPFYVLPLLLAVFVPRQ